MIRAVVFDIEGTIGDIAFVRNVLFPYARERLAAFLTARWSEPAVAAIVAAAREAAGEALATPAAAEARFAAWMDEDRKITPLKALQGLIWRDGYADGALKAHLYDDAVAAMRRYHAQGLRLCIYSSGSLEAQKLYLAHSIAGDLTSLVEACFDTTTGAKAEPSSYERIARTLDLSPQEIVFFSDAPAEVAAAHTAGMSAVMVERNGGGPGTKAPAGLRVIHDFTALDLS